MGNHRRNLFFHLSNGILRELMELDVEIFVFLFFFLRFAYYHLLFRDDITRIYETV